MGIEPPGSAWKADVLPLNYTRTPLEAKSQWHRTLLPAGGGGRIRTYEGISQQIYSLPPLAAWVPLLKMSRVFWGARLAVSMSSRAYICYPCASRCHMHGFPCFAS